MIFLRYDNREKPYFVMPHGQVMNIATAHKHFPTLIGLPTAQAQEWAKKHTVAMVNLKTGQVGGAV